MMAGAVRPAPASKPVVGLYYADQATGLTLGARARTLLAHSGDYEE